MDYEEELVDQSREQVTWVERRQQWRWTYVPPAGKTQIGWANTKVEALSAIWQAEDPKPVQVRFPRGQFSQEP